MLDASSFQETLRPRASSSGLRGTFKDLSREIRFSLDLQPRCIPAFRRFFLFSLSSSPSPSLSLSHLFLLAIPHRAYPPRFPSAYQRLAVLLILGNIPSVLSPGYFSPGVRSHCRVRTPWGPRIGPLSPELSVNAPFASSFPSAPPNGSGEGINSRGNYPLALDDDGTKRTFCLTRRGSARMTFGPHSFCS